MPTTALLGGPPNGPARIARSACNPNPGALAGVYGADSQPVDTDGDLTLSNHEEMNSCLAAYDTGADGLPNGSDDHWGVLFDRESDGDGTYDIELSPRFTWMPKASLDIEGMWTSAFTDDCDTGTNCDWDIKRFRPVFIGAGVFNKHLWYPGEPVVTVACGTASSRVDGFSFWVFDVDEPAYDANMLPPSLATAGPPRVAG